MLLIVLLTLPAWLNASGGSKPRLKLAVAGVLVIAVIGVILLRILPDRAKRAYTNCQFFEVQGELLRAQEACQEAVQLDPKSSSGLAAAEKLKALAPAIQSLKDKRRGFSAAGDPPCKAGKWVTRCIFKGVPRPTPIDGTTKARCDQDASELRSNIDDMVCPNCVCLDDFEKDAAPPE